MYGVMQTIGRIVLCLLLVANGLFAFPAQSFAEAINNAPSLTRGATANRPPPPATGGSGESSEYILGIGDRVRVTVFGEDDLSGDLEISSTGMISMPLVGEIKAAGTSISKLKSTIREKLLDGYMKDPKVTLEVLNYRPFFIIGEVMKPGSYNYVNGMTVINAVALAGGYTYRADKDGPKLKRGGQNSPEENVKEDTLVGPGDVVIITERFF
jgi:polysaccharide export outer membrane protein